MLLAFHYSPLAYAAFASEEKALLLSTDRAAYQGGDIVYIRAEVPDGTVGEKIAFIVTEPGGAEILKEVRHLSEFGLALALLPLDPFPPTGLYLAEAKTGDGTSSRTAFLV